MKDHSVKLSLLKHLAKGDFCSGESLGAELGISRAAISKHMQGIQEWGIDVFRVQGKGYQLAQPLSLLNEDVIQEAVDNPVKLFPIIDSTNQYLLEKIDSLPSGSVCLAEYQANGRGRRGRQWISPFGSNLYISMYWRLEAGMAAAMGLSLVVGVAIVEALERLGFDGVKLKWPNDLYFQDRKLAGILVELTGQAGAAAHLVIGMGMNIFMPENESSIDQPWASLSQVTDRANIDRNQLTIAFIQSLDHALRDYEMNGMKDFVPRWNRLDNFIGRKVKLIIGPREIYGTVHGISEHGAVLLQTENGLQSYIGGEISLRKAE
ncbi:bifunctional biotin--[acetyl-CoA-carboxylase] ligase/biotin operon repressor BirA [Vibrio aestuarianus]|uniref:Bifunctional ligase/repressor BirA n=1 Tax=Vibrio aestuarianus TaxID=28171 RepID=A0A7X6N9V8_9VIBR|nr:bifunctional biotin--[acetyl-CoA-carboxylase] ligase/biotin operon repressor BirA [Vibrio aestuarianus]KOE83806.1 biotin--[acetyl-CoA-carboxylase] synthetase [Vibrio alginolyticus]MDE1222649.1 bifunctional biotin--[acetyl-CoA-carboxylase] ligase/biotin operon repressor BirA [Vibrio aestuarianus]MDE1243731.1 bifunctional biotin--[acetyl-CoA-carboxylase] ligase/biotin operon repressor BirA [Vibrio aestuarianus]MDE1337530.1 bifunctional biotin--[acetyl-CoA-carboxylase] ligase/biotin operon repr